MTSFVSFNDEGPDITNETLKQLNEEQLFKRELVIALAKKLFGDSYPVKELDFNLDEYEPEVAEIRIEDKGTYAIYRLGIDPIKDQIFVKQWQSSYGAASNKDFLKVDLNTILELLPIYANEQISTTRGDLNQKNHIIPTRQSMDTSR